MTDRVRSNPPIDIRPIDSVVHRSCKTIFSGPCVLQSGASGGVMWLFVSAFDMWLVQELLKFGDAMKCPTCEVDEGRH